MPQVVKRLNETAIALRSHSIHDEPLVINRSEVGEFAEYCASLPRVAGEGDKQVWEQQLMRGVVTFAGFRVKVI